VAPPSAWLGPLGLPGWAAYVGFNDFADAKPGETIVVSSAAGAVGTLVGQLAREKGLRTVGIAGGHEKCRHAEANGYDVCVDYKRPDFVQALADATPSGIDIDFENVGGDILDAVWTRLNRGARAVVCGLISQYSLTEPRRGPDLTVLLKKRIRMEGFVISDHAARIPDAVKALSALHAAGRLSLQDDVTDGLENAPAAFIRMLQGQNRGKALVRLAQ
jgi:NADPH-dependent curcumin reductase CurA